MTNEKMKVWAYFKHNAGDFSRHWGAYIMLISVTNLFIGLAVIPFFNFAAQQTLRIGHVPYITLTNLGQILTHDPGVAAVLTLLGLLLLLFVYWQFTFLILGIQTFIGKLA